MSEFNIEVQGGSSVRLPTAGKYCDRDIIVTASGGGGIDYLAKRISSDSIPYEYYSEEVVDLAQNAFSNDSNLTKLDLPNCTRIRGGCCYVASNLKEINFPNLTTIYQSQHFQKTSIEEATFLKIDNGVCPYFGGSEKLKKITVGNIGNVPASTFINCTVFDTFIIRKTNKISSLVNANAFSGTPIASGTGYIYVPKALIEDYKVATNWATYANQFRALEDYTVDGTITGELDESKI